VCAAVVNSSTALPTLVSDNLLLCFFASSIYNRVQHPRQQTNNHTSHGCMKTYNKQTHMIPTMDTVGMYSDQLALMWKVH
jgi:hypothetical protein